MSSQVIMYIIIEIFTYMLLIFTRYYGYNNKMMKLCRKTVFICLISLILVFILIFQDEVLAEDDDSVNEIIITFGGDVTFGYKNDEDYEGTMPYFLEQNDMDFSLIFKNVYDIFSNDDLTMVNLETTITTQRKHKDKTYYFRAPYEYVDILKLGSIEAVSIANNHALDYYEQGRKDTIRTLMENDIIVSGENYAGSIEIKGIKVAILSYVTFQTGFNYMSAIHRDISYMDKIHDVVIVSIHWGRETIYSADRSQQELAHEMIDLGADLIIGHHPHVIQGIENYKDRYIVYSLGNCSFGGNTNPFNDDILLFQQRFKLTADGVIPAEARVIPCRVSSKKYTNDFMPTPFEGDEIRRVLDRVESFSQHLDYGLMEVPDDWIVDPHTRVEYRADRNAEKEKAD